MKFMAYEIVVLWLLWLMKLWAHEDYGLWNCGLMKFKACEFVGLWNYGLMKLWDHEIVKTIQKYFRQNLFNEKHCFKICPNLIYFVLKNTSLFFYWYFRLMKFMACEINGLWIRGLMKLWAYEIVGSWNSKNDSKIFHRIYLMKSIVLKYAQI
jgi:hypothetical protein